MKRYEISRARYYIGQPLKRAARRVRKCAAGIAYRITGRWWCYMRKKYHSGRAVALWPDGGHSDGCCSLHLNPEEIARCEAIAERVKKEVSESENE